MLCRCGLTVAHVDLNLLRALDALLEQGSVQGAAAQLHLTPSAMSRALSRLRHLTGDELFLRDGRRMVPTARALDLREETKDLVRRAEVVLSPPRGLDLTVLVRQFTIRGNDSLLVKLAPPLVHQLATQAPQVTVRLLGEDVSPGQELVRGLIDLEIGAAAHASALSHRVGSDTMAVAMRDGHPLAGESALTLAAFAGAAHVTVSRRGLLRGPVDDVLDGAGHPRRVMASLPSLASALAVLRSTDALTVAPRRFLVGEVGISVVDLPVALPPLSAVISWNRRLDDDAAHHWLRTQVIAVLSTLLEPLPESAEPAVDRES